MKKNEKLIFSTGTLNIEDKSVTFHHNKVILDKANSISRENIGHTDIQLLRILPFVEFVYFFRLAIIGVALAIIGVIIGFKIDSLFLFYLGIGFIFFAAALLFTWLWIDNLLGLKIASPILLGLFGVDACRVIVQNIYGENNLDFFIRADEKDKLPKFEIYKIEKIKQVENIQFNSNPLDDIQKLSDLRDKNIITNEEFELKKKQILGL
jgi:hypothetical protein